MPTGNTTLLGLALPVEGELDGTWGDAVNDQITSLLDSAVAGTTTLSADADVTLTSTVLAANQARQAVILWNASNGATTRNITAPARSKAYVVINAGTGSIVLRGAGPTTGVIIVSGERCLAAWNGSDFVKVASTAISGLTGVLPAVNGGTGLSAAGTAGNVLTSNGTIWESTAPAVTLAGAETLTNKTIAFADNTLTGVQPTLVSGTNIKTINGTSVLGSGDLTVVSAGTIQIAPSTSSTLVSNAINAFLNGAGTYTMPNLTGQTSFGLASLSNSSVVPATVTTSDGWSVTTLLTAGVTEIIAPFSTATAHGTWGSLAMAPPVLSTISTAGTTLLGSVVLSATLAVLLTTDETSASYVVAVNRTTGVAGTPVAVAGTFISSAAGNNLIYRVSDTSFAIIIRTAAAVSTVRAGSVSGTTITVGTGVNSTDDYSDVIQLSATSLLAQRGDGSIEAISISGTTVTIGSAVSVGAVSGGLSFVKIERVTDSTALVALLLVGGGSSTTREVAARVASVSGTTVTLGAIAESNDNTSSSLRLLQPFVDGGPFLIVAALTTAGTTGEYRAASVSGTTVTIGTVTNRVLDVPISTGRSTFITITDREVLTAPTGQIVLAHKSAAIYAVTCSGTTLTFGADFTVTTNSSLYENFAQDTIYSYDSAFVVRKLSFSGATISAALTIQTITGLTYIESDTLSNEYVAYSGIYYSWNLPATIVDAIAPGYWVRDVGATFQILGPVI